MKTQYLLIVILFLVSACGFHLRGSQKNSRNEVDLKVYLVSNRANTVAPIVKSQLANAVDNVAEAQYTLKLEREFFDQTVLSVSASTGKVEEYQITLSLYMTIIDAKGTELLLDEEIRLVRDYTFDEDAVLGKFAEEEVLREELSDQLAGEVMQRLNATINEHKK
jgi:LPS-assembly lipoprotein